MSMSELSHLIVTGSSGPPSRTMFVLHGILGSLRNWKTMARAVVRAHPQWRVVLVDLRNHGDSHGFSAPHTLSSCAADLAELALKLDMRPELVVGHSFGGKVALAYGRDFPDGLATIWVLDSNPAARPPEKAGGTDVVRVIEALDAIVMPLNKRDDIVRLLSERGFSETLGRWMTTNLRRQEQGYVWRFELDAVRDMLDDYEEVDLVPWVNDTVIDVHLLWAERSTQWNEQVASRLQGASNVTHHFLANAGHWVHADDPQGVLDALATTL